jgi:hypothetical protein
MPDTDKQADQFVSKLGEGRAAFLAEFCQYCLAVQERSPEDFIRHFSCERIMKSLENEPKKRAAILVAATATHEKIAPKMSATAAGETLQIALDEELTSAGQVVELFQPDDRQRHLEDAELWAFATEGEPWKIKKASPDFSRAQGVVGYGLERALHHKLLDAKALVSALTVLKLTQRLPAEQLAKIIEGSLDKPQKFSHQHLIDLVQPGILLQYLPLDYVWQRVVEPLIADQHGYAKSSSAEGPSEPAEFSTDDSEAERASSEAEADLFGDEGSEEEEAVAKAAEQEVAELEVREEELVDGLDEEDEEEVHTVENEDVIDGVDTDDDDVFDDILDEGLAKSSGPTVASAAADKAARRKASLN